MELRSPLRESHTIVVDGLEVGKSWHGPQVVSPVNPRPPPRTLKGGGRDTTREPASEPGGKLGYKEAAVPFGERERGG